MTDFSRQAEKSETQTDISPIKPPVFCLMGPTASGKTDLAAHLIQYFPLEIISVDSAMIYREMDIGTAKPSLQELVITPHHLIDILNPDESYSAAAFCKDVENLSAEIFKKGKYPLLVGGTMMYFQALQKGLSALPEGDEIVRTQLQKEIEQHGWDAIYAKLQACDPESANRLHQNDTQRVLRALEVYILTGKPLSTLCASEKSGMHATFVNVGLFPENRAWLHARIAQRFDVMLEAGLIEEVKTLKKKWNLDATWPSMRTVGYRQILSFLEGEFDYQQAKEKGIIATRQLAKRQLTWLRSFQPLWTVDPEKTDCEKQIIEHFEKYIALSGKF